MKWNHQLSVSRSKPRSTSCLLSFSPSLRLAHHQVLLNLHWKQPKSVYFSPCPLLLHCTCDLPPWIDTRVSWPAFIMCLGLTPEQLDWRVCSREQTMVMPYLQHSSRPLLVSWLLFPILSHPFQSSSRESFISYELCHIIPLFRTCSGLPVILRIKFKFLISIMWSTPCWAYRQHLKQLSNLLILCQVYWLFYSLFTPCSFPSLCLEPDFLWFMSLANILFFTLLVVLLFCLCSQDWD